MPGSTLLSETPKISIGQQAEAVRFAAVRQSSLNSGVSIREKRPESQARYDLARLQAAGRTLHWLVEHEAEIKAFLALSPEARRSLLASAGERHEG